MTFNSFDFLIFFAVAASFYFVCPPRHRWAWLLGASYYFYAAWALEYVVWLAVSTLIVYILAIQIAKISLQAWRKALLVLGLVLLLGSLGVLKYLDFFGDSLRALLGPFDLDYAVPAWQFALPVGISFYTFQALGYLIDVYRGKVEPERHLGILALFLSFFPQLVAGPIERAGSLIPQFRVQRELSPSGISSGLQLVVWGMFKKVVIADRLGVYVDAVYNQPADHQGLPILLATCFFAVQIYCDFSGYTDIALGAAKVMGYDLTANFRQPYLSSSIVEFWRRWHITLSTWFRDYLYIPMGGNRVPRWRWYANVMVVFALSGLWHGPSWTFVLWGALHGLYYLLQIWTQTPRERLLQGLDERQRALGTGVGVLATLGLVCLAWVFFRANSVSDAFLLLSNLGRLSTSTDLLAPWVSLGESPALKMAIALGLIVVVALVDLLHEYKWEAAVGLWQKRWVRWVVFLILALAVMNLGIARETPFVYLQF
jgi:D-alanyl-lipoteichoic acid acyltransferase DltB (MBOAT superfamily)